MIASYARCALLAMIALAPAAVRAEAVLDHLPEDTIGFAVVHNISAANAKVEAVLKIFEELSPEPLPGPLPLVKTATGLGAGINEQGDAALALLPAEDGGITEPRPLLLVAVSDYAAFAGSVNGDATGEICRVTIAGEEVLVAKRGSYAALMNVDHRERFEELLADVPKPLDAVAPLSDWLAETDVAAMLTPLGVDKAMEMARAGVPDAPSELGEEVQQLVDLYSKVLEFLGAEIDAVAAGIAIDDQSNVKLLGRAVLTKEGELADSKPTPPSEDSPFKGYADEAYVFAFGGPFPPAYGEAVAKWSRRMIEAFPQAYGLEDVTEREWEELEETWRDSMKGLRSMSTIVLAGEDDDPIYSNWYFLVEVENADAYFDSYKKAMDKWNALVARSTTGIKLEYETSEVDIDGKPGLLTIVDVAAAAEDPNVPMVQSMMKAMFGEDGKMKIYLVAADKQKLVMGIAEQAGVIEAMKHATSGEAGLAESSHVVTTTKLLDPKAPWQGLVSPPGCVAWFKRMFETMLAQFGGPVPTIPEYPDSPPVGLSFNLAEGRFASEMVWPVESLKALAEYIKTCQDEL